MTCQHYQNFLTHALEYELALADEDVKDDDIEAMRQEIYQCATAVPGLTFGFDEHGGLNYEYNP